MKRLALPGMVLAFLVLWSCKDTLSSRSEIVAWKSDHGLTATRTVDDIKMICTVVLPGEGFYYDSLSEQTGRTYLLFSFEPADTSRRSDVLFQDAESYQEFAYRLMTLAIGDGKNISVVLDGVRTQAIGAEMVYDLGLSPRKRLLATVPLGLSKLAEYDTVTVALRDDTFTSSVVAFSLDGSALADLPRVTL